ncbi:MAG TPA: hypothetical protein VN622_00870 [Clostridia bacterium]|nr:hypothetical protein [Clostridia bacterium]
MRHNVVYLVLLVISAAVFTVFICPFLESRGLIWVCVLFYIVIVVTFLYGRTAGLKQRKPRP